MLCVCVFEALAPGTVPAFMAGGRVHPCWFMSKEDEGNKVTCYTCIHS